MVKIIKLFLFTLVISLHLSPSSLAMKRNNNNNNYNDNPRSPKIVRSSSDSGSDMDEQKIIEIFPGKLSISHQEELLLKNPTTLESVNLSRNVFYKDIEFSGQLRTDGTVTIMPLFPSANGSIYHIPKEELSTELQELISSPTPLVKKEDYPPIQKIRTLYTDQQHLKFLIDAIQSANACILITSWKLNLIDLERLGIWKELKNVLEQGVKVYLYFKNARVKPGQDRDYTKQEELNQTTKNKLNEISTEWAFIPNHSKVLSIDNHTFAVGSRDWLSPTTKFDGRNASVVMKGENFNSLNVELGKCLKWYQTVKLVPQTQHIRSTQGLETAILRHEHSEDDKRIADTSGIFKGRTPMSDSDTLFLSVDALLEALSFSICSARERIIICSPFVQNKSGFKSKDICNPHSSYNWMQLNHKLSTDDLVKALKRNVQVIYATQELKHTNALQEFIRGHSTYNKYLNQFIFVPPISNMHQKTIVIDDNEIFEGSFNFFSDASSVMSEFNNLEVNIYRFDNTGSIVQEFYKSEIGMKIYGERRLREEKLPQPNIDGDNI